MSGEVTNDKVLAEPSLRLGKLRLNELTIVFGLSIASAGRSHWPMHGPQALASTVAPIASRSAIKPSRSMVARVCSLPGDTNSGVFTFRPRAAAWRAIEAARVMSSYELFVQLPMSVALISSGQSLARASAPTAAPTRLARSGECGPLISGFSASRSISITWSYCAPSSGRRSAATLSAASAMASRPVAFRYIAMLWS